MDSGLKKGQQKPKRALEDNGYHTGSRPRVNVHVFYRSTPVTVLSITYEISVGRVVRVRSRLQPHLQFAFIQSINHLDASVPEAEKARWTRDGCTYLGPGDDPSRTCPRAVTVGAFPTMCPGALPSIRRPKDHGVPTPSPSAPPLVLVTGVVSFSIQTSKHWFCHHYVLVYQSTTEEPWQLRQHVLPQKTACTLSQTNYSIYSLKYGRTEIAAQPITPPPPSP
jgi:hypothetical protein